MDFLNKHFNISDPRWQYCHIIVELIMSADEYRAFIESAQGVVNICRFRHSHYHSEARIMKSRIGKYHVIFKAQDLCRVPSVIVKNSARNSIDFEGDYKAFILPIIDRPITVNDQLKIVPNFPMIYERAPPTNSIDIPVKGIVWQFYYWQVDHITLHSNDRKIIKMTIANKTFDINYEQLICLIY